MINMQRARQKPLSVYRRRQKQRGIVRVEVSVRKEDAALVRDIVRALGDPERETKARSLLREHFADAGAKGLKDWLAAAPLEGIDLSRDKHINRDVDL
jgi:hypothetical protein